MTALAGPLHLLAVILVISGFQKVLVPRPAGQAMVDARFPGATSRVALAGTIVGAGEIVVGLVALAVPAWWAAAAIAAVYAAFIAFLLRLRAVGDQAGCGCFGATSTPPGPAHWGFNIAAMLTGTAIAVAGVPDIVDVFDDGALVAVTYVIALVGGASVVLVGLATSAAVSEARSASAATPTLARIDAPGSAN